jgi:hypothetical protein
MAKIAFDEDIQPYLSPGGDLALKEGREAGEQLVSLKIQDHLYDVLSQYDSDDIEAKIKKETLTIVRNTDYLNSIDGQVKVRRITDEQKEGSYQVVARIRGAENIDFTLSNL